MSTDCPETCTETSCASGVCPNDGALRVEVAPAGAPAAGHPPGWVRVPDAGAVGAGPVQLRPLLARADADNAAAGETQPPRGRPGIRGGTRGLSGLPGDQQRGRVEGGGRPPRAT